jgi:hypothetical protein
VWAVRSFVVRRATAKAEVRDVTGVGRVVSPYAAGDRPVTEARDNGDG